MKWWMRKMHSWTLQAPEGGEGGGGGGGSGGGEGGGGGDDEAAKAKAAEEEAARKKAEEDAAAAKAGKPTDAEAKLLKEVMQKKEALQKTQADLAAAQERLAQFDGVDPEAVKKLLADAKAAEEAQLAAKGDFDRLKQRMAEEHTASTNKLQKTITDLQALVASQSAQLDELTVGAQFSQSAFIKDELVDSLTPAKVRALYGAHFDLEDGKVVGYDKPKGAANRTALVDALGNPVAFDEAMKKIIEADPDRDHMIKSKVRAGAGSQSQSKVDTTKKTEVGTDAVSKIGAGLKSLNLLGQPAV